MQRQWLWKLLLKGIPRTAEEGWDRAYCDRTADKKEIRKLLQKHMDEFFRNIRGIRVKELNKQADGKWDSTTK